MGHSCWDQGWDQEIEAYELGELIGEKSSENLWKNEIPRIYKRSKLGELIELSRFEELIDIELKKFWELIDIELSKFGELYWIIDLIDCKINELFSS